jgi:catechol 2,3-dioxygenase-like lactoylglutathione lyase family enzyme
MEIRTVDHTAVLVADVERSRNFYVEVLGMDEIPRPKNFKFPGAWVRSGSFEIHIIGEEQAGRARAVNPGYSPPEMSRGYAAHLAFEVDDVEAASSELRAKEANIVGEIRNRGDGVMQMYVCDPDGYLIELFSRTGPMTY